MKTNPGPRVLSLWLGCVGVLVVAGSLWGSEVLPDLRWDGQFTEPGFGGNSYVVAVDGADVYFSTAGGIRRWNRHGWSDLGGGVNGSVLAIVRGPDGIYVGGRFSQAGNVLANNIARWTGTQWEALGEGVNDSVHALAFHGDALYVGGNFRQAGSLDARFVARWEFGRWHPLDAGVNSLVEVLAVDDEGRLFAGGFFDEAGGIPAAGIARWNGTVWSSLGDGLLIDWEAGSAPGRALALAFWQGALYVGGEFTHAGGEIMNHVARWDGEGWSGLAGGVTTTPGSTDSRVTSLVATDEGLFVMGHFFNAGTHQALSVALWNGADWEGLITGEGSVPSVTGAAATAEGDIYLAGQFSSLGSANTGSGIGRYRDGSFHAIGNGVAFDIFAIAVHNETVHAGGRFFYAGGVYLSNIGRWTGRDWQALGGGVNGIVRAVAVHPNGDVYAGGEFTEAGGGTARGLARWDGETWSAVGGGLEGSNPRVFVLHVDDTDVFVGGAFGGAGGVAANNVARWNGTAWSALGSSTANGVNGPVHALTSLGGEVFVGGRFDSAGGQAADSLAFWDSVTGTWTGIRGLVMPFEFQPPEVRALSLWGEDVMVGGAFNIGPAGFESRSLALWNGSSLSPVAGDLSNSVLGRVESMAADGPDLYVGGIFDRAGGIEARSIVRYDGEDWHALGSGIRGTVYSLAIHDSILVAGGGFNQAGGKPSVGMAQWTITDTAPGVRLVAPTNNASFEAGSTIRMKAELVNGLSGVGRVEFYRDLTLQESATMAPYEFDLESIPVGGHVLSVRAHTPQGAVMHSLPVTVTVVPPPENLPPVVHLITPTNNMVATEGEPVLVRASAIDLDGSIDRVEFRLDDVLVVTVNEAPYEFTIGGLARGQRRIFVRAFDDAGASTDSLIATVVVEPANQPPILEFISPRDPVYELPEVPVFYARGSDYDGTLVTVEFFANDTRLATLPGLPGDNFYRYVWSGATPGEYVPKVVATDNLGATTTFTFDAIQVVPPNLRPLVNILSPQDGAAFEGPLRIQVEVAASDPDGTLTAVRLFIGGTEVASRNSEPFTFELPSLADGIYCLRAEAEDERGGVSTSESVCVSVATQATRYRLVDLGILLDARESEARSINRQGRITGQFENPTVQDRAFVASSDLVFGEDQHVLPLPHELPPGVGPASSFGTAINDRGQVVGRATGSNLTMHAFLYDNGNTIDLGTLGGPHLESFATDINDQAQVVGASHAGVGPMVAFLSQNGVMRRLGSLGFDASWAEAINDAGLIVGRAFESPAIFRAFVHDANDPQSGLVSLGALEPEFPLSHAFDINNRGQIVGRVENNEVHSRPFLHEDGTLRELPTLGGIRATAYAINDQGVIVGHSRDFDGEPHACLWVDGQIYDLNRLVPPDSGWRLQEAFDINDCGQIVGIGNRSGSDTRHGFLLVPAPLPVTAGTLMLNPQTGLFEQTVRLTNTGAAPFCLLRLRIDGLPDDVRVQNGWRAGTAVYVEHGHSVEPGQRVEFVIEYFIPDRRVISNPQYTADTAGAPTQSPAADTVPVIIRTVRLVDGAILVEFLTRTGRRYRVEYSDDMMEWSNAGPDVMGTGSHVQWVDNGPPKTILRPATTTTRFYRVVLLPEATGDQ